MNQKTLTDLENRAQWSAFIMRHELGLWWIHSMHCLFCFRYKCHLKYSTSAPRIHTIQTLSNVVSGFSNQLKVHQNYTNGRKCCSIQKTPCRFAVHTHPNYVACVLVQHVRPKPLTVTSKEQTWRLLRLPLVITVRHCALINHAVPFSHIPGSVCLTDCLKQRRAKC